MSRDDDKTRPPPRYSAYRKPLGSQDSLPALTTDEREAILAELRKLDEKWAERYDDHEVRIGALEKAAVETRDMHVGVKQLDSDVRDVLKRDTLQESRIAELEKRILDSSRNTSARWGAVLGGAIAALYSVFQSLGWLPHP